MDLVKFVLGSISLCHDWILQIVASLELEIFLLCLANDF